MLKSLVIINKGYSLKDNFYNIMYCWYISPKMYKVYMYNV